MNRPTLVSPTERSKRADFSQIDFYYGTLKGFRTFVKPHLNKIVSQETRALKSGQKCSHPDCNESGSDFGHWPRDVDTILEEMLETYRLGGEYKYAVPLKEFCERYALLHRGQAALKVGRPVCSPHNREDQKIIKAKLTYRG